MPRVCVRKWIEAAVSFTGSVDGRPREAFGWIAGRWRIADRDEWEDLDRLEPAHITSTGKNKGALMFVAVEANLDVRYVARDGGAGIEFSWEDFDDGSPSSGPGCGRRWTPPAASSGESSSTRATILPSSPSASDFFNGLLGEAG
jgi:hypothetical protein